MPLRTREHTLLFARWIPGMTWPCELEWLYDAFSFSNCHAEIGTFCGKSLFVTANAMMTGRLLAVDNEQLNLTSPGWQAAVLENTIAELPPDVEVCRYVTDSAAAAITAKQDGWELDSLFIDGDHSAEGVLRDFECWAPLVKPGGIIAGHDYWARDPGVMDAVNSLGRSFEVAEGTRIWHLRKE